MTTVAHSHDRTGASPAPVGRQLRALAGTEWKLLLRNKVAAMNCLALPVVIAVFFAAALPSDLGLGVLLPVIILGTDLIFVIYYTLVTALVARRESLLLKRLRAGEASDVVILAGLALPFVAVTLAQTLVASIAAVVVFDVPIAPRIVLFAIGAVLACVTWTTLAVASTGVTKSVENAQITTLPLILVPLLLSGLSIPLTVMPDLLRNVAEIMPLTPVLRLASLAFAGTDVNGAPLDDAQVWTSALRPMFVLFLWAALGVLVTKKTMRWEARS